MAALPAMAAVCGAKVRLLELEKVDMSKLTVPTKGTAL